jgi:hypothetical protein
MFNFTLQRQLTSNTVVEAAYVGTLAHKLPYAVADLNRGKRVSKQLSTIRGLLSEGNSAYNALQLKAERRFKGYSYLVSYTFSKTLDNGPAPLNLLLNQQRPQDSQNLMAERGLASTDRRHSLTGGYVLQLPFARLVRGSCSKACQTMLDGWQFSGIAVARSGLPVNVIRNGNVVGYEGLRPNVLRDPALDASVRTLSRYFDTKAFSIAGLGAQQPGNAGRNLLRGPGLINLDASLVKTVVLGDTASLQLRMEAFNVTNTPHFANPNGDLSQGQFGSITRTVGNPRVLQFGVKISF